MLSKSGLKRSKAIESQMGAAYLRLNNENPSDPDDRTMAQHKHISCMMLAAYVTLKDTSLSNTLILEGLQNALSAPNSWLIKTATRLMLLFSRDPMNTLDNYTKNRIPPIYGKAFEFVEEGSADEQYTMRITKCFYNEFFIKNETTELTHLFCEWDKNWIDPISPSKHGVRFIRATTIADGQDSCPFTFRRIS